MTNLLFLLGVGATFINVVLTPFGNPKPAMVSILSLFMGAAVGHYLEM